MLTCKNCNKDFSTVIYIDNKRKNLHNRKYCLDCSPWGKHNTAPIKECEYLCKHCLNNNKEDFYPYNKVTCKKCFNGNWIKQQQFNRKYILEKLGGKCTNCGFNTWECSLDIHHIDASIKDKSFHGYKTWSKERIDKEIENCILLCSNCHKAYHSGFLELNNVALKH